MDYRDLDKAIDSNPGPDVPSCDQKLRDWCLRGQEQVIVDIRKAYLQVRLHPSLLRYQAVVWREKLYVMTRMGVSLAVAPKVISQVMMCLRGSRSLKVPRDVSYPASLVALEAAPGHYSAFQKYRQEFITPKSVQQA